MEKIDNREEQVDNVSRELEILQGTKMISRDQKHYNRNEECL